LVGWSCSRPKPAMHGCSIARQRINIAQAGNFKYVWLALSLGLVAAVEAQQGAYEDALGAFRRGRDIIARIMQQSSDNATLPTQLEWFNSQIVTLETR
jgi:hypothetical protein